jgi:hypothetical protein
VFVICPQVPEFSPVACTVNFKLADVEFAIFLIPYLFKFTKN